MRKLKVAVIGCGKISGMHLDSITALEEVELVAVCDIRSERADEKAEKYHAKAYTDYSEMFEKEALDAVHICLPHYLHTVVAQEAFRKGIHVLCEKPMSIRYEDAVETVNLAEQSGLQYGVIFQSRYNTHAQLVKRRIEDGRLGAVKCARAILSWYHPDEYYSSSDWKGTWDKEGGGVIINQAIHSLDLSNWFIDSEPVEIQASLHNRAHKHIEVEDSAEGLIRYENGALLAFYVMNNYLVNEPVEIRLQCQHGKVVYTKKEAVITYDDGTVESMKSKPQEIVSYSGGASYWGTQHAVQVHQFYKAVLGLEPLELSGSAALKTQKLICEIYQSNDGRI